MFVFFISHLGPIGVPVIVTLILLAVVHVDDAALGRLCVSRLGPQYSAQPPPGLGPAWSWAGRCRLRRAPVTEGAA